MTEPVLLARLREAVAAAPGAPWSTLRPEPGGPPPRRAAVLMLFAAGADGRGELLLTQRSARMRSHPGQVAFPGGALEDGDAGPAAAALREAQEETGLDPAGVQVLGELPDLYLPPSNFQVTPVVGWWHTLSPVGVWDPREVARAALVPLPDLLDPAARFSTRLRSGHTGPAFEAGGFFVWGFTAGLLSQFLTVAGMEIPWDRSMIREVPGIH